MSTVPAIDFYFEKGGEARFGIDLAGVRVSCYIELENAFFANKASPGQSFPSIVERYASLVREAAELNIARDGVSSDIWGNRITAEDLAKAQANRRSRHT